MKYPFALYNAGLARAPIFPGLQGDPFVADLSRQNPLLDDIDVRDQRRFQNLLADQMEPHYTWGFSGYLERRDSLLRSCPQMVTQQRFYHLGLDIIVACGTRLHAPLQAVVVQTGYEAGEGNYGGFVLLKHHIDGARPFYSFYGHLSRGDLPDTDRRLRAGEAFATIGDFHENGNWFYHTHLQVITEAGLEQGYIDKGYCAAADLPEINDLCPSPLPLFLR
jgi:hypothetical protein